MSVKGSDQERLIVVTHNPKKRRLVIITAGFLLLALAMICYYVGFKAAMAVQLDSRLERDQLKAELAQLKLSQDELKRAAAQATVASQIDRQANEQVRQLVLKLEQQIADQNEEIAFYKGMMAPTEKENGISIRGMSLLRTANGNGGTYQFQLVIQQLAAVHTLIKGAASVTITGMKDDQPQSYSLRDLSQQFTDDKIKLRFKYFQTIDGELVLPSGFEPRSVEVVAQSHGKKPARVERSFDWIVQEN